MNPQPPSTRAAGSTHAGLVRAHNEDSFVILNESLLYCVTDGMGGHRGGAFASSHVCSRLSEEAHALAAYPRAELPEAIRKLFARIDREVADLGLDNPELFRMGTTAIAAMILPPIHSKKSRNHIPVLLANVGDSRAYVLRDGHLTQLTIDHSWYNDTVSRGIQPTEYDREMARNTISRCIGVGEPSLTDVFNFDCRDGDLLVLCSDGLYGYVAHNQIQSAILQIIENASGNMDASIQRIPETLIEIANNAGGYDNTTVIAVGFGDRVSNPDPAGTPPVWLVGKRTGSLMWPLSWTETLEVLKKSIDERPHVANSMHEGFYANDALAFQQALALADIAVTPEIHSLIARIEETARIVAESESGDPDEITTAPPGSYAGSELPATAPLSPAHYRGQTGQILSLEPTSSSGWFWSIGVFLLVGAGLAAWYFW